MPDDFNPNLPEPWRPIETMPKDGTLVLARWHPIGRDDEWYGPVLASWRTVPKPASYDPLSGECFAPAYNLTGVLYADQPYRVPGIIEWVPVRG